MLQYSIFAVLYVAVLIGNRIIRIFFISDVFMTLSIHSQSKLTNPICNKMIVDSSDVIQSIRHSKTVGFGWSKNEYTVLRHTAIVIIINRVPRYTLDFAVENDVQSVLGGPSSSGSLFPELASKGLHEWNGSESTMQNLIMVTKNPNKAKEVFVRLYNLLLRDTYNIAFNNCRDYVDKAVDVLKTFRSSPDVTFYLQNYEACKRSLSDTRTHDAVAVGVGAGLVLGGIKLLADYMREDDEENNNKSPNQRYQQRR